MRPPGSTVIKRLVLVLAALCACLAAAAQTTTPQPWRVVIVTSVDPALPAALQLNQALRQTLQKAAPGGVTFFNDSLDVMRFDFDHLVPEFLALARKKYAAQRVDLVVGVGLGDDAIDFIREHRAVLWPGAGVVLSTFDELGVRGAGLQPGVAHLHWRLEIDGTLDLIETLQPRARRLVVVGGGLDMDRKLTALVAARAQARPRWQTETWIALPLETLRARLAALPPDSAVIYTRISRDAEGRAMYPVDALSVLASTSRPPLYGMYGSYAGRGMTAGMVIDFADSGRRLGERAVAVLNGQPIPAAGTLEKPPSRCVADYTQLKAHGLAVSALPAGCELRNPPRNAWTEYRGYAIAAASVVLAQALTIAGLLLQRRRRHQAEAEALRRRTELSRAMRFAAMGELTASIAHEINQPLGAILSNADAAELMLQSGTATPDGLREILADIRRDDLRAHEVIRRLRALLEKHEVEHVQMHLHAALDDVLALLAAEARKRGMLFEHRFEAASDSLLGDAVQLQQVVMNLALNAMDAMEHTEPAARRLEIATVGRGDAIELTVADRGLGIEASRRGSVFESFFTTKPGGLGLGLSIVRAIVEAHEGRIDIAGREGGGTIVVVTLPRRLGRQTATHTPSVPSVQARPA